MIYENIYDDGEYFQNFSFQKSKPWQVSCSKPVHQDFGVTLWENCQMSKVIVLSEREKPAQGYFVHQTYNTL